MFVVRKSNTKMMPKEQDKLYFCIYTIAYLEQVVWVVFTFLYRENGESSSFGIPKSLLEHSGIHAFAK